MIIVVVSEDDGARILCNLLDQVACAGSESLLVTEARRCARRNIVSAFSLTTTWIAPYPSQNTVESIL